MPDGKPLDVGEELRALHASVLDVRDKLEEEGRKRDVRIATSERAIADAHTASVEANAAADTANHAARRSNWVALGAVVVALCSLVVGGIGIHDIRDSNAARCLAGNEFRRADRARWDYIIRLSPPPTSAEAIDRLNKFKGYIATADALKHC